MIKIHNGIIEGNIIRFEQDIGLPNGTKALVTLKTVKKKEQEKAKIRQLKLLDKGFYLGQKKYKTREDIYAR